MLNSLVHELEDVESTSFSVGFLLADPHTCLEPNAVPFSLRRKKLCLLNLSACPTFFLVPVSLPRPARGRLKSLIVSLPPFGVGLLNIFNTPPPRQADREVQEYRAKIRQRRQQQQRHQGHSPPNPSLADVSSGGPVAAALGERAQKAAASWPGGGSGGGGSVSELSEPSTGTRGNLEVGGGQSR